MRKLILFLLFLFAVQFAYIMITWHMVHYAAYMGARSAMTVNNVQRKTRAEAVTKRILAVVSVSPSDNKDAKDRADDKYIKLDGWGRLPNTKYLDRQVEVEIPMLDVDPRGLKCQIQNAASCTGCRTDYQFLCQKGQNGRRK